MSASGSALPAGDAWVVPAVRHYMISYMYCNVSLGRSCMMWVLTVDSPFGGTFGVNGVIAFDASDWHGEASIDEFECLLLRFNCRGSGHSLHPARLRPGEEHDWEGHDYLGREIYFEYVATSSWNGRLWVA